MKIIFGLFLVLASFAHADSGFIMVTDREDKICTKTKEIERKGFENLHLNSHEVVAALRNYFNDKSNPGLIDVSLEDGNLKFCDLKESKVFADFLFTELSKKNPPRKAFDVYKQYAHYKYFEHLRDQYLANKKKAEDARRFKANLELAKSNGWVD